MSATIPLEPLATDNPLQAVQDRAIQYKGHEADDLEDNNNGLVTLAEANSDRQQISASSIEVLGASFGNQKQ